MSVDRVLSSFLTTAAEEATAAVAGSDILLLLPRPDAGLPPDTWDGSLVGVQHLERTPDRTVRVSDEPVQFSLHFPAGYCHSGDPQLTYRVLAVHTPVFHPNVRGRIACLGSDFRPGTRLRALVEQVYLMVSGRVAATESPLDAEAARHYLGHADQVRGLRARPLWRRAVAGRTRVEELRPSEDRR